MSLLRALVPALLCLAAVSVTPARGQAARRVAGPPPSMAATRLSGPAPRIDGNLNDPAWAAAPAVTGFVQFRPQPGAPASERSDIRLLYDDRALYIGARLYDSAPDSVAGRLFRRDGTDYSDWFYVTIDSYFDRRTGFSFAVNPRGVQKDVLVFNDVEEDLSWDAVWEAAARVDSLGWTAELRIPLSQLRFSRDVTTWGINFQRRIARRGEISFWSPVPADLSARISRSGTLTGLDRLCPAARFELQPYGVARLDRKPDAAANPFYGANDLYATAGADLKYGLTSNLTLTGTLNPDFAQVEVDPAVVNLTVFENFFEEKRPFFTEGADIFAFGSTRTFGRAGQATARYFYSRRIGRPPQGQVPDARFVDFPAQTTIAGAAKVTGRTPDGWSVGVLDAVTPIERARYIDPQGRERSLRVEPLTNYFTGRVRRDLRAGQTILGGMLTAVNRTLDDTLAPLLHEAAYFGGLDFVHAWSRRWAVSGYAAGSLVEGSPERLRRTQAASTHYFQRPDAEHLSLDPSRTRLSGLAGELSLAKIGGRHWLGSLTYQTLTPGLEVNDLGFQLYSDRHALTTHLSYQEREPGRRLRRYSIDFETSHVWNYGGRPITNTAEIAAETEFTTFWTARVGVRGRPWGYLDRTTRGGPLMRQTAAFFFFGGVGTDTRRPVHAAFSYDLFWDASGEYDYELYLTLNARPTSALQLRFDPGLKLEHDTDQYVAAHPDPLATRTYGTRYVFGDIDQVSLSFTTRADWTFSPNLSLQLYLQPLLASGNYLRFKEFREAGTFDFDYYGTDRGTLQRLPSGQYLVDPDGDGPAPPFTFGSAFGQDDFVFRSLRGNLVLRWEYRPGSRLYFVWQHLRSGDARDHALDPFDDLGRLFAEPAENIFQIKLDYWLGR